MEKPISATTSLGKGGEIRKSDEQWDRKKSVQRLETLFQGDKKKYSVRITFVLNSILDTLCFQRLPWLLPPSGKGVQRTWGRNLPLGIWNQKRDLKQLS